MFGRTLIPPSFNLTDTFCSTIELEEPLFLKVPKQKTVPKYMQLLVPFKEH